MHDVIVDVLRGVILVNVQFGDLNWKFFVNDGLRDDAKKELNKTNKNESRKKQTNRKCILRIETNH